MAGLIGAGNREVIRVKVKKCDGLMQPEYKKFCIDPQITSFEVLQSLLARAFTLKGDFTISYLSRDSYGRETYLSMLSDWDLDASFLSASDPSLRLKVDLKPFEEGLDDWDIIGNKEVPQHRLSQLIDKNSLLGSITGTITTHVGKTVSQVSKAMGLKSEEDESCKPNKEQMTDAEFHNFLDGVGVLIRPRDFRLCVYQGGVEPALRRVVWRHLLNIYPDGMTGKERFDYLKNKSMDYFKLRDQWHEQFNQGGGNEMIKYVTNMVKKDVLRTDRTHPFYAGSDDNKNVLSLFNILVTYALTHPQVSYCQGMSDIASPILVIEKDEAHAYVCFCGAMQRLKTNFLIDGEIMNLKFQHLSLLLQHHDPDFYTYLKQHNADDMFFCYRWLLLELKREFPFDDALLMLETMWSSLLPNPPDNGMDLTDADFKPELLTYMSPISTPGHTHAKNAYMHLMHMRKHVHTPQTTDPTPDKTVCLNKTILSSDDKNSSSSFDNSDSKQCNDSIDNKYCHNKESNGDTGVPNSMTDVMISVHESSPGDLRSSPSSDGLTPGDDDVNNYIIMNDSITRLLLDKSSSIEKSLENINTGLNEHADLVDKPTEPVDEDPSVGKTISRENSKTSNISSMDDNDKTVLESELQHSNKPLASVDKNLPVSNIRKDGCVHKTEGSKETKITHLSVGLDSNNMTVSNIEPTVTPPSSPKRPTDIPLKEISAGKIRSNLDHSSKISDALIRHDGALTERTMELSNISSCEEATEHPSIEFIKLNDKLPKLPPPQEFGCGNPFLMFLCLTLLMQQRDHIIHNRMDYNDLAMHFDKMVRRHNVQRVLHQAKSLYAIYIRNQASGDHDDKTDGVSV